jgi:hypothetical protein
MSSPLPRVIADFRDATAPEHRAIIEMVWAAKHLYLRWPERALLFMPGTIRSSYHEYSPEQLAKLRAARIKRDTRSNGPAIMAFNLAGGERPLRANGRNAWSVHHIYDGEYAAPGRACSRAVTTGTLFTQAAGLVAIHSLAHALAHEFGYFAWMLRYEAFVRFAFDPDAVFSALKS